MSARLILSTLVLGPTFERTVDEPASAVADRLASCAHTTSRFELTRVGEHFQISIPQARRHRWSPWLTLEIRTSPESEATTHVFGRFNPSPGIWTGYMLASISLITIAAAAATWGSAELLLAKPPTAFLGVPLALAALILMWLISAAGQRLARNEIAEIRAAVDASIDARC